MDLGSRTNHHHFDLIIKFVNQQLIVLAEAFLRIYGYDRTIKAVPGSRNPSGTNRIGLSFLSENIVSSFGQRYSPLRIRDFDRSCRSNCMMDPFLSREKDVIDRIPRVRICSREIEDAIREKIKDVSTSILLANFTRK